MEPQKNRKYRWLTGSDPHLKRILRKCRDARTMAKAAIRIAKRRKLPIHLWEGTLNQIKENDWEYLRVLALRAEAYRITLSIEEHDQYCEKIFETRRFFGEIVNSIDIVRPPTFTYGVHLTPCTYCGLPTDSRSVYFCPDHYHDGMDYKKIRRMENWSNKFHGMPLADLVRKREKDIRTKFRANPELYLQGRTAAAFRGQMLRPPKDVIELITFLVGKHEPPPYEIMNQIAIIVLAIVRRNETWRQIMDEYRTPRGGRPIKDIDEALPEAKARLEKNESIRYISKIMDIPYSTLRRRLSK